MALLASRTVQPVVADLSQALGQDMLEKTLYELCDREPHVFDLLGAIVPVAKGYPAVLEAFQAGLGDGAFALVPSPPFPFIGSQRRAMPAE